MLSLFKGPLQSLCRSHCVLTTMALVCALVLVFSFCWLFAVSSCPFQSASALHFHAPPVFRRGLRNMPPIMIASTALSSCPALSHRRHLQTFLSCSLIHTIEEWKGTGLFLFFFYNFWPLNQIFIFSHSVISFKDPLILWEIIKIDFSMSSQAGVPWVFTCAVNYRLIKMIM